jgi:hypothetical protein
MKKEGHELLFVGGKQSQSQYFNIFDKVEFIPMGNDLNDAFNPFLGRKWVRTIERIAPDIIHANDVIAARFALGTEFATVFDDHEYMSNLIPYFQKRKFPRNLISKPRKLMIPKWETILLERYPTITVSEMVAKDHRRRCRWVGVTPNVPTLKELESIHKEGGPRSGLVYVGNDFQKKSFHLLRDMSGLRDILDFDVITGLSHDQMMQELTKYKIGLTPWKQVRQHYYASSNKTYEYQHAGLQVVTNKILARIFSDNPYVYSFEDYSEIYSVIEAVPDVEPSKIMDFALEHYIWEKHEHVIKEAYKKTKSNNQVPFT